MKKLLAILFVVLSCAANAMAQVDAQSFADEAVRLQRQAKLPEALTAISKAIEIEPENYKFYAARAKIYGYLNKKDEMFRDWQRATALNPTDRKFLYEAASELYYQNHRAECNQVLSQLIALKPADETTLRAYNLRALNKSYLKDYRGAVEDSFAELELTPLTDEIYKVNYLFLLRYIRNLPAREESFKDTLRFIGLFDKWYDYLEPKAKHTPDGLIDLKDSFSNSFYFFSYAWSINLRGIASKYDADKQTAQADELYKHLVKYESRAENYLARAKRFVEKGKPDEALADLIKSAETGTQNTFLIFDRGELFLQLKQYDRAIADYEKAKNLSPSNEKFINEKIAVARQKQINASKQ